MGPGLPAMDYGLWTMGYGLWAVSDADARDEPMSAARKKAVVTPATPQLAGGGQKASERDSRGRRRLAET